MATKILCAIAGPNGSGKTTVIGELHSKGLLTEEFITPDEVVREQKYLGIKDETERYLSAMRDAELVRNVLLERGISFSFETVFSHPSKVDFILKAKQLGYFIDLIYVATLDPAINIDRVARRVSQGGHDVPVDKILSRWHKSFENVKSILNIVDQFRFIDNSGDFPEVVAIMTNGSVMITEKFIGTCWDTLIGDF
ncbi:zeta toxin family protein [Paenibacillus alba]|uniref:UDP-N-acetylglucosamine kinase n=1 Tax=Paenibacillus alba TaxID=1197127 RepID=A0ABU6G933_9BACL|nr:zeta toxin family protein [Paenibacillus alba]MEC0229333.1 zeta toxin family protein [Paenibacillus alba]